MSIRRVVSIGYERRSLAEFISILQAHGVTKAIDIRDLPLSRRKGFSKTPLSEALAEAGIEYCHLKAAGNPYRHLKDQVARCLALYAGHLRRHPEVVQLLRDELKSAHTAVFCFERLHRDCHRSRLLDALSRATRVRMVQVE